MRDGDGQIYDAFDQMKKFVRMAKVELIVIDPYFDDSVLPLIAQKKPGLSYGHRLPTHSIRKAWSIWQDG
jgi:hypothetical protein